MTAFPWDRQICLFELLVWGYSPHEVALVATFDSVDMANYQDNGAWELVSSRITHAENYTISLLTIAFELRRYSRFSIVNVFIPIVTLAVLNTLAFFIPAESGEKLSYCITVLLALAVYLSTFSDYLPTNSNKMACLCFFLLFKVMMSTFICACTVFSLLFYHKTEPLLPPQWLCGVILLLSCRKVVKVNDVSSGTGETDAESDYKTETSKSASQYKLTWQDVSLFVDRVCFFVSFVWLLISSVLFAYFVSAAD